MNEHKLATWFFIFMLFVAAGIVAWAVFLNKGTLIVSGNPPFTYTVDGKSHSCDENLCEITLKSGKYLVRGEKDNFASEQERIEVRWLKKAQVNFDFTFMPSVSEIDSLPDLPNKPTPPILDFYFKNNPDKNTQGLYVKTEDEDKLITQFKKPFDDASFFPSPDGTRAVMRGEQDEEIVFLFIDLEKKSKSAFNIKGDDMQWLNSDWIAYEIPGEDETLLQKVGAHIDMKIFATLPNIRIANNAELLAFISFKEAATNRTFGDILGESGEAVDAALAVEEHTVWELTQIDLAADEPQAPVTLIRLDDDVSGGGVTEFHGVLDQKAYFSVGEIFYEAVLREE